MAQKKLISKLETKNQIQFAQADFANNAALKKLLKLSRRSSDSIS